MVMRSSDSSTGAYVPALRPVGGVAITIAVLCAVLALSMDFLAYSTWRMSSWFLVSGSWPMTCSVSDCDVVHPLRDETLAMMTRVALLTWVIAGLGVALAGLLWIWRVRLNAEVLSPVPPRLARWWSVGCWFVPIANLVLPPLVLVDICAASCAGRDPREGYVPSIRLVRAWWVAQLTCVVLVVLIVLGGQRVATDTLREWAVLWTLLAVVGHGAAALSATIVLKISADQTRVMNLVGDRPRRPAGHVIASLLVLALLVGFGLTAHRGWAPPDCGTEAAPCPPTPTPQNPPPVRLEPPPPAGRHPVVIHDCDLDSGYSVREERNPPPETGRTIDVHAIEVYQTRSDHGFRQHPEGAADVYVHATIRPQVLMLKAYEPTLWRVHADEGVTIAMVVLDGYHPQRVEGAPAGVEVVTRETWPAIPNRELALLAETPPASETYCYDAGLFSIRPYTDEPGK
jgi:hypothetical protein